MRNKLVAGVDCSTQSTKVLVVDIDNGEIKATGKVAHNVFRSGGASETDPENWWDALAKAIDKTGYASKIEAISIAAQQLGVVTLDKNHKPLRRAILWDDTRSATKAEQLVSELGGPEAVTNLIGTQPLAGFSVCSWAWLKDAEPEIADKTAYIRLPHDYITEKLTGNGITDRGDASGTGWWSSRKNEYINEVLDHPLVGLKQSILPKVLEPNDPAGRVIKSAADWTGLNEGIPVACGTGDNAAAALGLAINPGTPVISLGTSGTAYLRSLKAPQDLTGQVFAHASASGDHLPLTCTLNATLAVDNLAKLLSLKRESVSKQTDVVVMPFLSGERLPNYPNSRGSVYGIDHSTKSGEILLGAYEGVVYSLVQSLEVLNEHSSGILSESPILLVGGGAKGKIWQDTIVRFSGRDILIPKSDELVAYGAASQAAGILNNENAIDISTRWNISDGERISSTEKDIKSLERIKEIREYAHEINSKNIFC